MLSLIVAEALSWLIAIIAGSSLIFAVLAYRSVMRTTSRVDGLLDEVVGKTIDGNTLGSMLRAAYPPEDIAGIGLAIIEAQKPSMMNFMEHEGLPLLAKIGGAEVASTARLARVAGSLGVDGTGKGAGGLQALQSVIGLLGRPTKGSGIGDLMQYLPLLQQFTQNSQSQSSSPENGGPQAPTGNYHVGGKLGGN